MFDSGHIFISYKSEQRHLAFQVKDKLQEWGYETWLDVDRLQPGTYWANDIDVALKSCRACIGIMTPPAIKSRYVTNEWDMAIMKGKLFLPLMFEHTEPHYKYIDIQYVDFTSDAKDDSYSQLKSRLQHHNPATNDQPPDDPYHDYLQQLYDRINKYLSAKLITSLRDDEGRPEPIHLSSSRVDGAVDALFEKREEFDPLFAIGGIADELPKEFRDFSEAIDYFDGRVLLLGEPGSGKTITLLHFARDAVVKRRQDITAPLPILGIVPTWNPDKTPDLVTWITSTFGAPENSKSLVQEGRTLLLLDGLDELGEKRIDPKTKETYDPRLRFIDALPASGRIVVTSRSREYYELDDKAKLSGAIILKPLNEQQLYGYLKAYPELKSFMDQDKQFRKWLETPLLISLFTYVFQDLDQSTRKQISQISERLDLRDLIIGEYVKARYKHESHKPHAQLLFDYAQTTQYLAEIAMNNSMSRSRNIFKKEVDDPAYEPAHNILFAVDFARSLSNEGDLVDAYVQLCQDLHLIVQNIDNTYSFTHLWLRDYFATRAAQQKIKSDSPRDIETAILVFGSLRDYRYISQIIPLLTSHSGDGSVAWCAAVALADIGNSEVMSELLWVRVQRSIGGVEDFEAEVTRLRGIAVALGILFDGKYSEDLKDWARGIRSFAIAADDNGASNAWTLRMYCEDLINLASGNPEPKSRVFRPYE